MRIRPDGKGQRQSTTTAGGGKVGLDHVIVLNRRHLVRILREYLEDYYHPARTHLSLCRDSPNHREIEPPDKGEIVELPVLGGLHHIYSRREAA